MITCCGNWCGKSLVKCTLETIKAFTPTALRQGVLPVVIVQPIAVTASPNAEVSCVSGHQSKSSQLLLTPDFKTVTKIHGASSWITASPP